MEKMSLNGILVGHEKEERNPWMNFGECMPTEVSQKKTNTI